ncbi:hypothetical protein SAMN02745244_03541 [Tessaracoccus bendigoensis DSM 12906]|uniref:Uncharacterized protein n=1 Tax=Tessaracoccus bendigoensis DSM 12906 TaxID=1123357 RepID=A0A1M6N363_9ACTN|nr:DUF6553 family protein [Tessaracoccus bendigoensis]SHJ90179.1 hypothetical protein SAMN02745244_03541 [Tessaracoccus bendigoensis DSM 12906]
MAPEELELARYGRSGKADHFLGFWLSLIVEARGFVGAGDARRVRKAILRFLSDTAAAEQAAGAEVFQAELRDAARRYWGTTQTDPSYSSNLFGLMRIGPGELRVRVATEAAKTVQMLIELKIDDNTARQLPTLLIEALIETLPDIRPALLATLAKRPQAAAAVGHLLAD